MKAYKVFNSDWTCKGFQYEVGKSYEHKGEIRICKRGFHACVSAVDCFNYYGFDPENKVAEVECDGEIVTHDGDSKVACSKITIIRELEWSEVLELVNTGIGNMGLRNSGNRNSGNRNSGNRNSGNRNSGNRNSGYGNSGDRNSGNGNSGYGNSGYGNSGNRNSGDRNSGNGNSGYGNSGDRSAGIFCSERPKIVCFNKPTDKSWDEIDHPVFWNYELTYVDENDELRTRSFKEVWAHGWGQDSDDNKLRFFNLPNFDLEVFKEITGLDVAEDYERLMT